MSEAGEDRAAAAHDAGGKLSRHAQAVAGRLAGADDRDRRLLVQIAQAAFRVKDGRRRGDLLEAQRIRRILQADHPQALLVAGVEDAVGLAQIAPFQRLRRGFPQPLHTVQVAAR